MAWILLSLLLLVLAGLGVVLWQLSHLGTTLRWLRNQSRPPLIDSASVEASPNMDAGTTWLPTDRERATIEQQLQSESRQRAGSGRSRRTWTPKTG